MIWLLLLSAAEPPNRKDALKWLYRAAGAGSVRAQYQLALCLHHGGECGLGRDIAEAVCSAFTITSCCRSCVYLGFVLERLYW